MQLPVAHLHRYANGRTVTDSNQCLCWQISSDTRQAKGAVTLHSSPFVDTSNVHCCGSPNRVDQVHYACAWVPIRSLWHVKVVGCQQCCSAPAGICCRICRRPHQYLQYEQMLTQLGLCQSKSAAELQENSLTRQQQQRNSSSRLQC